MRHPLLIGLSLGAILTTVVQFAMSPLACWLHERNLRLNR